MTTSGIKAAAIDVTHRCNLKCTHCYWWKERQPEELVDSEMVSFMRGLRERGLFGALMYGGEPMMRPNILKAASEIFELITIFTNGTLGYLDIPAQWILSLDGTEEIHDKIRGEGVFEDVMRNLPNAPIPPVVHMTVTQLNKECLSEFMQMISKQNINGVGFSFYTPSIGKEEKDIFIPLAERNEILQEILELRKKYPKLIGFTERMAYQYRTDGGFTGWNSQKKCDVSELLECYTSNGARKMCTYGEEADCSRCGCAAVVAYRAGMRDFDPSSLLVMNRLVG